jgi:hypothetical protein
MSAPVSWPVRRGRCRTGTSAIDRPSRRAAEMSSAETSAPSLRSAARATSERGHQLERAVHVADADVEERVRQPRPREPIHDAMRRVPARGTVPDDEIVAFEGGRDAGEVGEVELPITVDQEHVVAPRRVEAASHRRTVAPVLGMTDHAHGRAFTRDRVDARRRVVLAPVVDDDDLDPSRDTAAVSQCITNDTFDGGRLVTAGHHDGEVRKRGGARHRPSIAAVSPGPSVVGELRERPKVAEVSMLPLRSGHDGATTPRAARGFAPRAALLRVHRRRNDRRRRECRAREACRPNAIVSTDHTAFRGSAPSPHRAPSWPRSGGTRHGR